MTPRMGLALRPVISSENLIKIAQEAGTVGYESLWLTESTSRDAIALLGAVSQRTSKIKLGTGIINVYSRRPTTIAMAAATIDELTRGRMILGLGASTPAVVGRWGGCRFENQLQRVRECVEIVCLALKGEPFSYNGKVFAFHEIKLGFTPLRKEIPIYVAALNPRMAQLCGELGVGCLPNLIPPEYVKEILNAIRIGAEKSGSISQELASFILTSISENATIAFETCRDALLSYASQPSYSRMLERSGFSEEANSILRCMKSGDREGARKHATDSLVEAVTASGTASDVKRKIAKYRSAGINLPIIFPTLLRADESSILLENLSKLA